QPYRLWIGTSTRRAASARARGPRHQRPWGSLCGAWLPPPREASPRAEYRTSKLGSIPVAVTETYQLADLPDICVTVHKGAGGTPAAGASPRSQEKTTTPESAKRVVVW